MPSTSDRRDWRPRIGDRYKLRDPRDSGVPFEVVAIDEKARKVSLRRVGSTSRRASHVSFDRFHSVTYDYEGDGTEET